MGGGDRRDDELRQFPLRARPEAPRGIRRTGGQKRAWSGLTSGRGSSRGGSGAPRFPVRTGEHRSFAKRSSRRGGRRVAAEIGLRQWRPATRSASNATTCDGIDTEARVRPRQLDAGRLQLPDRLPAEVGLRRDLTPGAATHRRHRLSGVPRPSAGWKPCAWRPTAVTAARRCWVLKRVWPVDVPADAVPFARSRRGRDMAWRRPLGRSSAGRRRSPRCGRSCRARRRPRW